MAAIDRIREKKVRSQNYEFTVPHFFEEMANDDLIFADIETAVLGGRVRRRFTSDPNGTRYEIVVLRPTAAKLQLFAASRRQVSFCLLRRML